MSRKTQHHNRSSRSFLPYESLRNLGGGHMHSKMDEFTSDSDLGSYSSVVHHSQTKNLSVADPNRYPISSDLHVSSSHRWNKRSESTTTHFTKTSNAPRHRLVRRPNWLRPSRSKKSQFGSPSVSARLAPAGSMSSIANSSISSPMLTSTSNARVADAEKVHRSEVLFPISSSPNLHSQRGNVGRKRDLYGDTGINTDASWSLGVKSMKKRMSHNRRASTGISFGTPWSRSVHAKEHFMTRPSLSERHVGKMAICKEKLHQLGDLLHMSSFKTGNEVVVNSKLVKAKGIRQFTDNKASSTSTMSTPREVTLLPVLTSDSTTDLLHGSLSRSFASAVDKLEPQSSSPTLVHESPSMSSLRHLKKSILGLRDKYKEGEKASEPEIATKTTPDRLSHGKKESRWVKDSETDATPDPMPDLTKFHEHRNEQRKSLLKTHADPLRSHPNVMSFATPSEDAEQTSTSVREAETHNEETDKDRYAIDKAILYSESTRDLSLYSRTPSPVSNTMRTKPITERVLQETPTKKPFFKGLKQSFSTIFKKSTSKETLAVTIPEEKEESTATLEVRTSERGVHEYQPVTPSPLRTSQVPAEGVRLRKPRTPASNIEKRHAVYGEMAFPGVQFSRADLTKPYDEE